MRKKPDLSVLSDVRKDPSAFIQGGAADRAEHPQPAPAAAGEAEAPRRGRGRVQKIFNFPEDLADRLRDEAASRSRETGSRVTEKDIVVAALEAYFINR
jgi:hypothetical protein